MTRGDDWTPPQAKAPEPDRRSPVPLPVDGRGARLAGSGATPAGGDRRWWPLAIVGGVAFALLVIAVSAYAAWALVARQREESASLPAPRTEVPTRAVWTGSGDYAVVEILSQDSTPALRVVAWNRLTGETRSATGLRLVTAEAASDRVWLARPGEEGSGAWAGVEDLVSPGMVNDGPGTAYTWDLGAKTPPQPATELAWRPWRGPSGLTAALGVDPTEGLYPGSVTFASRGRRVRGVLPEDTISFVPLGWSRDGRYFAIQSIDADGLSDVAMLDTRSGKVVPQKADAASVAALDHFAASAPIGAAWDPAGKQVWAVSWSDEEGATALRMEPGGRVRSVTFGSKDGFYEVFGTDGSGVLVSDDTTPGVTVWRLAGLSASVVDSWPKAAYTLGVGSASASGTIAGDAEGALIVRPGATPLRIWPPTDSGG